MARTLTLDDPRTRDALEERAARAYRRAAPTEKALARTLGISRQRAGQLRRGEYPRDRQAREDLRKLGRFQRATPWPLVHDYAREAASWMADLETPELLRRLAMLADRVRDGLEAQCEVAVIVDLLAERGIAA